jgi:hypothetical protein
MTSISAISNNVLTNDVFPADGEVYSAVLVTAPSQGVLVLNADGTFTYTPDPLFTGGSIVFTYQVVDNGYTSATSNTATVTINYATPVLLSVNLLDFDAELSGDHVAITWIAEDNQSGDYFVVEESTDGKSFVGSHKVAASVTEGTKAYNTTDDYSGEGTYYRIKIVNKDQSVTYSKVVLVKGTASGTELQVMGTAVQSTLSLVYSTSSKSNATVTIYSISGAKLTNSNHMMNAGANRLNIQVNHLITGTYVVVLASGTNRSVAKFIKK